MITKITGEQPFQVLTNNFSISPSSEGYTLQISADGTNFSNLFQVGANVTRLVTGVAANSYYRLLGNQSKVSINWMKTCVTEGGAAGNELTPIDYFPLDAEEGIVVAYNGPASATGVYQYDGSEWIAVGVDDLSAFWTSAETKTYVDSAVSGIDLSAYWTSAETQSAITAVENHLFDVEEVTASALTELHDDVLELSARTVDLSGYYTSGETDAAISAATAGKADAANVTANTELKFPAWNEQGIITGTSFINAWHAVRLDINGHMGVTINSVGNERFGPIYAPVSAGSAGDILVSTGGGAPVWSAVTMPDMSRYTPTSGFSTINGSAITNGGNIVIEGGAADPTTLKSVSDFNPDAENGDVQSKYVEVPGLPDGVSFQEGQYYSWDHGDEKNCGTITIPVGFAAGTTDQNPIYLFSFSTTNSYDVYAYEYEFLSGGVVLKIVNRNDEYDSYDYPMGPGSGDYGNNEGENYCINIQEVLNDYMIADIYAGYDYGNMDWGPDPIFDVHEASTEYGLYIKTEDGWEEISAPEDVVTSSYISNIWKGTQAEYNNIATKDPDTFYIIVSN